MTLKLLVTVSVLYCVSIGLSVIELFDSDFLESEYFRRKLAINITRARRIYYFKTRLNIKMAKFHSHLSYRQSIAKLDDRAKTH